MSGVELEPGQVEIDAGPAGALLLGEGTPYVISEWAPGGLPDRATNDRAVSGRDGRVMGRETFDGKTIDLSFFIDHDNIVDASAAYSEAMRVWDAAAIRAEDGAFAVLRARMFNLPTRLTYGRPRRMTPAREEFIDRGVMDLVCDFDTLDHYWYADAADLTTVTIPIVPPDEGGWTAPFTAPISVTSTSEGFGSFTVDGHAAAPLVARVYGPTVNPYLDLLGRYRITWLTTLARDQWIDLDTRPWVASCVRSDGRNLSGAFTADTPPMSDMVLEPGAQQAVFGGTDDTGTSRALISWAAVGGHPYWL